MRCKEEMRNINESFVNCSSARLKGFFYPFHHIVARQTVTNDEQNCSRLREF